MLDHSGLFKHSGKVEIVTGMFVLFFLVVLMAAQMQIGLFRATGLYMEDALAASNLASALVDVKEYGRTHILQIASPQDAYECYQNAIKQNLQLDDNWECMNKELIAGKVEILQYIIYNVKGQDVTVYCFGKQGSRIYEEKGGLGIVTTPDKTVVESTTIYSRIGFPVEGILGIKLYAEQDKTVDIVTMKEE